MTANNERYTELYNKHVGQMVSYARNAAIDEAEDVVHDTFMEVMALTDLPEGEVGGLLMQRLKWRITDLMRKRAREFSEGDLLLPYPTDEAGEEILTPMAMLELMQTSRTTPAWPYIVEHTTPEDLVSANQLRDHIRDIATAEFGDEAWAIFCAVTIDGVEQARVAKEFRMDQSTVSRTVDRVRTAVQAKLIEEGYDV